MANEKFTQLPTVTNSTLNDIIAAVQNGISVQQTLGQVLTLMQANIIKSFAGDPNGNVAGIVYGLCWDITNAQLYVCVTSGNAATAVWQAPGYLTGSVLLNPAGNQTITAHNLTLQAGEFISGSASGGFTGALLMYPITAAMGSFIIQASDSGGNFSTRLTNAAMGQPTIITIPDPVNNNANVLLSNFSGAQHITSGSLQVDNGNLISGTSTGGSAGNLILFSPTAASGFIQFTTINNSGNFGISFTNAAFGQSTTITIPDPGAAAVTMALERDGTFTPTMTCSSPGDLSVSYANQTGVYTKIGNQVILNVRCQFTPTFTTASGPVRFASLPFTVSSTNGIGWSGSLTFITGAVTWPVGTTSLSVLAEAGETFCSLQASGSAVNTSAIQMSGLASGMQYQVVFTATYRI